jgi:adenylate kinase family enzyme
MEQIKNILRPFKGKFKKVRVYALVGDSGTGKSFRARLVAEKYDIDLLIDDGLLIRDSQILAGKSAKREKNRVTAVKRAIFDDAEYAQEIRETMAGEKFKSLMIIGTSEKMVAHITDRLNLPYPDQIIYIEDVASTEEIARAREIRRTEDKHVIPVPVIEVKKDPSHRVLDSIKFFLKTHPYLFWKNRVVEKTIVQPSYSFRGRLSISEAALAQMIIHCVEEYEPRIRIRKMAIDTTLDGYLVKMKLIYPYGISIPSTLAGLQDYIIKNVERYSGIFVKMLHLTVDRIEKPKKQRNEEVLLDDKEI